MTTLGPAASSRALQFAILRAAVFALRAPLQVAIAATLVPVRQGGHERERQEEDEVVAQRREDAREPEIDGEALNDPDEDAYEEDDEQLDANVEAVVDVARLPEQNAAKNGEET